MARSWTRTWQKLSQSCLLCLQTSQYCSTSLAVGDISLCNLPSYPMKPPPIFARCYKSILGCQSCVDSWYRGDDGQQRTCPKYREPGAYVKMTKVNGLDNFLISVARLFDEVEEEGRPDSHQLNLIMKLFNPHSESHPAWPAGCCAGTAWTCSPSVSLIFVITTLMCVLDH